MSRNRSFCFTIQESVYTAAGWAPADLPSHPNEVYAVWQLEKGTSTGNVHIQGYISLSNSTSMSAMQKKWVKGAALTPARGTAKQNKEYCTKEDKDGVETRLAGPWERGRMPTPGEVPELAEAAARIAAGESVDKITEESPHLFHQYGRTLDRLEDIQGLKKVRTEMTQGLWLYGPTGCGKTHTAMEGIDVHDTTSYYFWNYEGAGWQDRYRGQELVIIDDFRGQLPLNELLRLCDKYPYTVPRRGRQPMPFVAKKIIVTSALHPRDVYKRLSEDDKLDQLYRRFEVRAMPPRP